MLRLTALLFVLLAGTALGDKPNYQRDREAFEASIKDMPRVSSADVGAISGPLPDRRAFNVHPAWTVVKIHRNDINAYLVKNFRGHLVPNLRDKTRQSYLLWSTIHGEEPEIVMIPCGNAKDRQANIDVWKAASRARKQAHAVQQMEAQENRDRRRREMTDRKDTRKKIRQRRFPTRFDLNLALDLNASLADDILSRIENVINEELPNSLSDKTLDEMGKHIRVAVSIQNRLRDMDWCREIEDHIAPEMWRSGNRPKDLDPESVVVWLLEEVERQTEMAELSVDSNESARDSERIE